MPAWAGLLWFAALLAAVQWFTLGHATLLPLQMLATAAAGMLLYRWVPWHATFRRLPPRSALFALGLYFVFVAHFAAILLQEARRLFIARRMVAPRIWAPGGFSSLRHALAALFGRTFLRAERFYAALLLRGDPL